MVHTAVEDAQTNETWGGVWLRFSGPIKGLIGKGAASGMLSQA